MDRDNTLRTHKLDPLLKRYHVQWPHVHMTFQQLFICWDNLPQMTLGCDLRVSFSVVLKSENVQKTFHTQESRTKCLDRILRGGYRQTQICFLENATLCLK